MVAIKHEYSVDRPLNREPPTPELVSSYLTGANGYDRNHGPIPHIDASSHTIHLDGAVKRNLELSISNLKEDFTQHEVISVLQCAGNRRHTMRTQIKEVQGIDWFDGAVMNCRWRGPRLRDILEKAVVDIPSQAKAHVAFACHQQKCQEDDWYGGSTDLERVMSPDSEAILAYEMNGEPLTPNHGYPVRVVIPGIAGARWVKWLDRITVQLQESPNHYQQRDYKILPPQASDATSAQAFWDLVPPIQEMPINSVIAYPQSGSTVTASQDGMVEVGGYALPQGSDGPIISVQVSADGEKWTEATLLGEQQQEPTGKWSWTLWKADVKLDRGSTYTLQSRATDSGGNVQKASCEWNLRGVAYNGYGEASDIKVQ